MKLLIAENSQKIPTSIKYFAHDQARKFPADRLIRAFGFSHLQEREKIALFRQTDALAAQSSFADKRDLEKVAHLFARGDLANHPYQFHILGLIHQLNLWITTDLTPNEKNIEYGFHNYPAFARNVKELMKRGMLFNIEEKHGAGKLVDSVFNAITQEMDPFSRFRYHSLPVLFNEDLGVFHTAAASPLKVISIRETIVRI